ncbi:uncharacterized protein [Medicago truncatula]|uniref:uncharacterized protein n=1 Tax=Medicago truncatula TaxID=3880 RepID=UPI0019671472|nr:uncharacterized protein LOC120576790 [Medicago truncatula]
MDYEAVFKRLGATLNLEKQAWVVVPLNSKTIHEQIEDFLSKEYDLYVNELKSIEVGKDPEHASTDVVFEEGGANKVDEKKRGRKIKNIRVGPISCSFKLPPFCYDPKETDDIEKVSIIP